MGPNPAARWLLCTGILLISLRSPATCEGLASEAQPPPNYQLANQCCNDPNILERPCRAGSIFNCTHGSYLLDPFQDPLDAFTIGGDGSLSLNSETLPYPKGEYCLSVSESPLHNESHYVARVCFWEAENVRYAQTMFTLKGTLALISVVFLGLTVYVYNVIVMRDTQDRVTRIAIICLLAFFLCIGATQLFSEVLLVTHTCSVMGEWMAYGASSLLKPGHFCAFQFSASTSPFWPISPGSTRSWRTCGRASWCRGGRSRSIGGTAGTTSTPGLSPPPSRSS